LPAPNRQIAALFRQSKALRAGRSLIRRSGSFIAGKRCPLAVRGSRRAAFRNIESHFEI